MDNTITYLNTDLDLTSLVDLNPLASEFRSGGVYSLHVAQGDDRRWYAIFETDECYAEPEPNIAAMLEVIERLPETLRAVWDQCSLREFNIGYDCGDKPWAFNQRLSPQTLARIAATGASLAITLYPDKDSP